LQQIFETEGVLLQFLPAHKDHRLIYNNHRDLIAEWYEIRNSQIHFPTGNFVDWVRGAAEPEAGSPDHE
jgi:hypothetical protein